MTFCSHSTRFRGLCNSFTISTTLKIAIDIDIDIDFNIYQGQGLTRTRCNKIQQWEAQVHETGATVDDVAKLEKILKTGAIILRDITGDNIYNSGKYHFGGNGVRGKVELIDHNGHAWSKDLHFPQSREVTPMRATSGTPSRKLPRVSC